MLALAQQGKDNDDEEVDEVGSLNLARFACGCGGEVTPLKSGKKREQKTLERDFFTARLLSACYELVSQSTRVI